MKLSGADITIKLLERQGIREIAGIPGGAILPIYDSLFRSSIRHILCRHEQGGGFIAHGMARSSGKVSVCFATSGPGATNLLTAIADAKLDSVPVVFITGQVPYNLIGTDAFQEVDTYGLTIPITKHNFIIRSVHELLVVIPEAFRLAAEGRPGPVLVDIPKNVQTDLYELDEWPEIWEKKTDETGFDPELIQRAAEMINKAKKPVLYIGGGVVNSNCGRILSEFARKNSIPVASTLMGLGAFPCDDPLYLGMLGMHGARYTNYLLSETDVLLAFGVRFDDRATGSIAKFCPEAQVIHVDIDSTEINKVRKADISIMGDLGKVLERLLPLVKEDSRPHWMEHVRVTKEQNPFVMPDSSELWHPVNIIKHVSKTADAEAIIVTDVGQHQMWVAQVYPFNAPRRLITSAGLGTMGFGLPAAIGASLENPDKQIICFSGDGSILMNIQELATLADLNLNVKIIILNNKQLGLVRQQQELIYNKNYIASKFQVNPDFAAVSNGFGISGYDLEGKKNPYKILETILAEKGPAVINIPVAEDANVLPIIPPGGGITEMIGGENHAE